MFKKNTSGFSVGASVHGASGFAAKCGTGTWGTPSPKQLGTTGLRFGLETKRLIKVI